MIIFSRVHMNTLVLLLMCGRRVQHTDSSLTSSVKIFRKSPVRVAKWPLLRELWKKEVKGERTEEGEVNKRSRKGSLRKKRSLFYNMILIVRSWSTF